MLLFHMDNGYCVWIISLKNIELKTLTWCKSCWLQHPEGKVTPAATFSLLGVGGVSTF